MPSIACLYIPRFAVEAERQRHAEIATQLILVGDASVLDCSLGAEASGVRRGMRMSEAIGLCHRATVLPPDSPYYERLFDEVLDFLQTLSPEVERGEPGLAYISLSGLPVEEGSFAENLIAGVHRRFGFMPSVGLAAGKFASSVVACMARPGVAKIVSPGGERDFLAPLSVEHLPASEAMRWRLSLLGITTMGEVTVLPVGAFQAQFGPEGKRCWELAQGIDNDPLIQRLKEEAVVRRLQMPAPAVALDAILAGVERLVHAAYGDARRGSRWVRKAIVRGVLDGGGAWELAVPFREALSDPRDAWFAIKAATVRRPPERPVEELEVELVGLSYESGKQATMFEGKGRLWQQVEEAVRQLSTQRERPSLGKVMQVDPGSRIPERRAALLELEAGDV
jgi:nucleotidyltransferase/DNA polymerase involved in DNA repair